MALQRLQVQVTWWPKNDISPSSKYVHQLVPRSYWWFANKESNTTYQIGRFFQRPFVCLFLCQWTSKQPSIRKDDQGSPGYNGRAVLGVSGYLMRLTFLERSYLKPCQLPYPWMYPDLLSTTHRCREVKTAPARLVRSGDGDNAVRLLFLVGNLGLSGSLVHRLEHLISLGWPLKAVFRPWEKKNLKPNSLQFCQRTGVLQTTRNRQFLFYHRISNFCRRHSVNLGTLSRIL